MKWMNCIASKLVTAVALVVGLSQVATADSELGLKNFTQVYQNLIADFGIDPVPNDLRDMYVNVKPRLPQNGSINDMNTATPVAHLMLAHKACQVFVNLETNRATADRRAFGPIDFKAAANTTKDDQLQTVITNLGNLLLMDPLSSAQQAEMMTRSKNLITLLNGKPQDQSLVMTEICTMIASSAGALVL